MVRYRHLVVVLVAIVVTSLSGCIICAYPEPAWIDDCEPLHWKATCPDCGGDVAMGPDGPGRCCVPVPDGPRYSTDPRSLDWSGHSRGSGLEWRPVR